jgi:uncharacterized protein
MSLEIIEKTFERVFQSGLVDQEFSVSWHAGEPLVVGLPYYEKAFSLVEKLRPHDVNVRHSFQTNGTLLNDAWCELIKEKKVQIGVSVDGPAFLHDRYRKTRSGAGTHDKVVRGMQLLRKHDIPIFTISVITREALDYPDEIYRFLLENGVAQAGFNFEEKEGVHASSSLERETAIETRIAEFMSRIYDLSEANEHRVSIREITSAQRAILGWSPLGNKVSYFEGAQENAPFKIINVDWAGNFSTFSPEMLGMDLAPFGKIVFGNVLRDSFGDAVRSEKFQAVSRAIRRGVNRCKKECSYFSMCAGGAPVNKIYENGTFECSETLRCRLHIKTVAEVVLAKMEKSLGAKTAS